MISLVVIFSLLTLVAGNFNARPSRLPASSSIAPRTTFKLKDIYQGQDFLNQWDFFSESDPTHGLVDYQTKEGAIKNKLAFVQDDGTTVLAVDNTTRLTPGQRRKSVRITSKKTYNGGLFIADFFSMPHGCSVWPAYWSVGPNWPNAGEIDVLEGVHDQPTNQVTFHTSSGCNVDSNVKSRISSKLLNKVCTSGNGQNAGCGFSDSDTRTYGHQFNLLAGGVYAHLWTSAGIQVWHFPRGSIPQDITDKNPDPTTWGSPAAFLSSQDCDINKHFHDHSLVINTSLCGDFAGATYASSGCPGTCAERVADPANFELARWNINYIAVYDS